MEDLVAYIDPIARLFGGGSAGVTAGAVIFRIALSFVMSAVIGCERATKRHAAGLRTFIIGSLSGTVAMLIDCCLASELSLPIPIISAATVISVAIISTNSVLFSSKSQIKGLTTSIGLWATCALGIAVGAGLYTVAIASFVSLLVGLSLFPAFEQYLKDRSNHFEIHLELTNRQYLQDFVTTMRRLGVVIDDIELNPAYINSGLSVYSISLTIRSRELKKYKRHDEIIEALRSLEYVYYIDEQ